jgi:hypothetical protein
MNEQKHRGLLILTLTYRVGVAVSAFRLLWTLDSSLVDRRASLVHFVVFVVWGGLIWSGAYLAVKKGREMIEGALLGVFGPLGLVIEVLLPRRLEKSSDLSLHRPSSGRETPLADQPATF